VAGTIGLVVYLIFNDWAIAAFSSIISFPIIRIVSTGLHDTATRRNKRKIEQEDAAQIYDRLNDDEKEVVLAFVRAGGSVLTWSQVNNLPISRPSIESLIQREVLWTSTTADGMQETFAVDSAIFDIGQERAKLNEDP
jgi:hypothetical protein